MGMPAGEVAVSLILIVGVVMGTLAIIRHGQSEFSPPSITSSTKFCEPAPYKDACLLSVEPAASNASATPRDYILAALRATMNHLRAGGKVAADFKIHQNDDQYHHMAVEDCRELLSYAEHRLHAAMLAINHTQVQALSDRNPELLSWLSAVYTYQTDCLDGFQKPEYKSTMEKGLVTSTHLTNNAVSIIANLGEILAAFSIPVPIPENSANRRLLQVAEMGHGGFPSWFSAADRKLLAAQAGGQVAPDAVVAKDGSGQFNSISDALNAYPLELQGRYIIYVKEGIYEEKVVVQQTQPNVFIYGDGVGKTVVTGKLNFGQMKIQTSNTATFSALGDGFIAKDMTFENTAGVEGEQAVALRILGDMAAAFQCSIQGFQHTLYYQAGRQFFTNCKISGTVDFIFGKGKAVIQNSIIEVRKGFPGQINTVTADGREVGTFPTGLVLQNCTIVAGSDLAPQVATTASYLGRPWKPFSLTAVMESDIGNVIWPAGYVKWDKAVFETTCQYMEHANRGCRKKFQGFFQKRSHGRQSG